MSLKRYMTIDLLMLAIVGAILEGVGTYLSYSAFAGMVPTTVFSVLILFIALVRWKQWGLLTIPVLALGNLIGALVIGNVAFKGFFDFLYYLSLVIGLLACGLILPIFKNKSINLAKPSIITLEGLGILAFVLFELARLASYILFKGIESIVISSDILGLVILIVVIFILYQQEFIVNVKAKLLFEKELRLAEKGMNLDADLNSEKDDNKENNDLN